MNKKMSRQSVNINKNGSLFSGYDYENQAWVMEGKYIRCGHPDSMDCGCFGKEYEGKTVEEAKYMLYNSL